MGTFAGIATKLKMLSPSQESYRPATQRAMGRPLWANPKIRGTLHRWEPAGVVIRIQGRIVDGDEFVCARIAV